MKGLAGTPITCHRFTTPLLTSLQPPAVPGQDLPPPRGAPLPRGTRQPGSPVPEGSAQQRDPQCPAPDNAPRQNHAASPVLLGILKESPSPACDQGDVNHPRAPQPSTSVIPLLAFVSKMLLCVCIGGSKAPSSQLWWHLEHSKWPWHKAHGTTLAQGIAIRVSLCPALSLLPVPLCHLRCLSLVPSAMPGVVTSPAAPALRGCGGGQTGAEGHRAVEVLEGSEHSQDSWEPSSASWA